MVVIQRVEEVTACCKVFLSKSQELQVRMSIWREHTICNVFKIYE